MAQRRFHQKSRHGCAQCKKNRTKCDEKKPTCGRCERIGADCSLAARAGELLFMPEDGRKDQMEEATRVKHAMHDAATVLHSPGSDSQESLTCVAMSTPGDDRTVITTTPAFSDQERDRLRLMNHYSAHTSKAICEIATPGKLLVWRDWVPEMAFKNDYLLHCLLSLSALHLVLCNVSPQENLVLANYHHGVAVSLFRPHLSNITSQTYDSIFGFSCLIALYSFGIQRFCEPEATQIAKMRQVLILLRGTSIIVRFDPQAREGSRWFDFMTLAGLPSPAEKLPDPIEAMLDTLQRRADGVPRQLAEIFTASVRALRINLTVVLTREYTIAWLTVFSVLMPDEFWGLLEAGDPFALAILANYAVILHWLRRSIWTEGWGVETVRAVEQVLPEEWRDCIAWALQETSGNGCDLDLLPVTSRNYE